MKKSILVTASLLCVSWAKAQSESSSESSTVGQEQVEWQFAAGISHSIGSQMKFHEVKISNTTGSSGATVDTPNILSLNLDARYLPKQAWGAIVGFNYDMPRRIRSGNFSGAAWGTPFTRTGDQISIFSLGASAAYRWDDVYAPIGINVSSINYETAGGSAASNSVKGGIGVQFGIGAYVQKDFALELMCKSAGVKLKSEEAGVVTEYNKGFLTSLNFGVKYLF
ncbi:hypothetical protein [Pseudobdellovibrio exovorus]|uniref:Outer membrane protein beta-barrel domain-containing protein n=1 Tax=Pseudobdellovibrio exovorus JSS TaxID=1184267 RepID=M4V940_9BACT|nr:hypothetical protein [Pseudobdellovibrio exovorus]AGH94521.1 hypothetical protein A11Q_301 [Pseudobdellovibrio exovorus JSS]